MSASTLVHNTQLTAETNPKDVGYLLATTVGDDDAVVFTKTSLVNFLKLHGIQVDTNYTELKRLPKYASFGKLSAASDEVPSSTVQHASSSSGHEPARSEVKVADGNEFRPTRRVREDIGGGSAQISALFGTDEAEASGGRLQKRSFQQPELQNLQARPNGDAPPSKGDPTHPHHPRDLDDLSSRHEPILQHLQARPNGPAPPSKGDPTHPGHPRGIADLSSRREPVLQNLQARPNGPAPPSHGDPTLPPDHHSRSEEGGEKAFVPSTGVRDSEGREFRPTRRVREAIGGGSEQIASLFGGDVQERENAPPRRQ